jgi:hypothetical protein
MKYGKYHCKYSYFGNLVEIRIPKKFSVCSNKWTNYKHFQKESKSQIRKAEWNCINDTIMEGLQNNNLKPFWKYVKSRKQDSPEYPDLNPWFTDVSTLCLYRCFSMCLQITCSSNLHDTDVSDTGL